MFDKLKDMGAMLGQMREAQKMFKDIQEELKHLVFEGESSGVKVTVSGEMDVLEVVVPQNIAADGNFKRLELCVKEAGNKALSEAKRQVASKFKGLTGGMNIPGLF